jgi:hypothetical protein
MARGWIPAWIPPEAFDLREVHSLDSGESALSFRLPAGLAWQPPAAACRKADASQFYEPGFSRDWIPGDLDGYEFHGCPDRGVTAASPLLTALAISRDGRHVLHWRYIAP